MEIATVTCRGEEFYLSDWELHMYEKFKEQAEEKSDNNDSYDAESAEYAYLQGLSAEAPDESTCCFCGAQLAGDNGLYGRNPDPANTIEGKRCCGVCEAEIVIPARAYINKLIKERTRK